MASYLHRTAQPSTLATFRFWGGSIGAGRIRLAVANIGYLFKNQKTDYLNYCSKKKISLPIFVNNSKSEFSSFLNKYNHG